jgi:hypothetical protein
LPYVQELLKNPLATLLLLPLIPLFILADLISSGVAQGLPPLPPLPGLASQTTNLEEWVIKEDPKTGEIRITVHRSVRRI